MENEAIDRIIERHYPADRKIKRGRPLRRRYGLTDRDKVIQFTSEALFARMVLFRGIVLTDEDILDAIAEIAHQQGGGMKFWWEDLIKQRERSEVNNGITMVINHVKKAILKLEKVSGKREFSRSHPDGAEAARSEQESQTPDLDEPADRASVDPQGERREDSEDFPGNPDGGDYGSEKD